MTDPALHAQQIRQSIEAWLAEQAVPYRKRTRRIPAVQQEPLGLKRWQYQLDRPVPAAIAVYQAKIPSEPFYGTIESVLGEIPLVHPEIVRKNALISNLFLTKFCVAERMDSIILMFHSPLVGTSPEFWLETLDQFVSVAPQVQNDLIHVGLTKDVGDE